MFSLSSSKITKPSPPAVPFRGLDVAELRSDSPSTDFLGRLALTVCFFPVRFFLCRCDTSTMPSMVKERGDRQVLRCPQEATSVGGFGALALPACFYRPPVVCGCFFYWFVQRFSHTWLE